MVRSTVIWSRTGTNYRLPLQATVEFDLDATVSFLQSSRSAEPHLFNIECSEAAVRDLSQPAITSR